MLEFVTRLIPYIATPPSASLLDTSLENHRVSRLAGDDQRSVVELPDHSRGNKL
jgi:hypothetical protein